MLLTNLSDGLICGMSNEDNLIKEMTQDTPPEGAIWCSDCGQWIEEECEHFAEIEQ